MSRIVDPVPHYSSIEKFLAEEKAKNEKTHTKRSGLRAIDVDRPEWWPGYTQGVIEALSRHDKARENYELERGKSTAPQTPIATTRL